MFTINNLDTAGSKYVVANIVKSIDRSIYIPIIGVNKKTGSKLEKELEEICEVRELILRVPRAPKWFFPLQLIKAVSKVKGLADICHSFDYASDWTEGLVMKFAGIPWVVEKTNLLYDPKKWALKLKLCKKIVCISQAQMDILSQYKEKLSFIPIGVNVGSFENSKGYLRSDLGLGNDDVVLISVAHLVEVKGHIELLTAFSMVKEQLPKLKLLLAGEGNESYTNFLKKLAKDLNLEDVVYFLGGRDDVKKLLKTVDGKILATRNIGREGFGVAIVEEMAASLPVIATRSGGPEDIVLPNETGWLISPDGTEPIKKALLEFYYTDKLKRVEMGKKGLERVKQEYNTSLMVQRFQSLYQSVLKSK